MNEARRNAYQWRILQQGQLPLLPDGGRRPVEHVCTSTLVWPEGDRPSTANSVIVDPSFSPRGLQQAERELRSLAISLADIGYFFITHPHDDHVVCLPPDSGYAGWKPFEPDRAPALAEIAAWPCPGHDPALRALRFTSAAGEVWITGDAVLDEAWLRAWAFYWPNGYDAGDIVETWRSVAAILSRAHTVIPGHGDPIPVTDSLIAHLIERFPAASHSSECPDVLDMLRRRLRELSPTAS